ncbi:MAG TPA: serine/threonine-protein kinase [Kofleriaceae bacterium]|nr:serine/threonine-protein kinase [Kofleriaceae bacterium]
MDRIGNYRIDRERRRDADSVVYEARHLVLPRRAFVKVMHEVSPQALAVQLLREACILEALDHPGSVRVYESGLIPERRAWFAYERVDGSTVRDMLLNGPLDPAAAAAMLRDIAEILDHAHRRGVVHCGLKPENIVVAGRTRGFPLCITDWSDARAHDTSAPARLFGPADYTAPELVNGDAVDDRADIFALGVIAYQALTGDMPFDGVWIATVADGSTQHVPTEVRCPDAPPQLCQLVDQMLAWDRFDRPSSFEAKAELAQLAADISEPHPQSAGVVRIRKPKWTPSLPLDGDAELIAIVTSDDDDKPTKSS